MIALNDVKADFSNVYTKPYPNSYYSLMNSLKYQIPENAKPVIDFILSNLRMQNNYGPLNILDLGCSYGVLAALIKYDLPLYSLFQRYSSLSETEISTSVEKSWFSNLPKRDDINFYGVDISENAIKYAKEVGLIKSGTSLNLELPLETNAGLSSIPKHIDLIVSTGCVGYITDKTFSNILDHLNGNSRPVIASFVLRAFDFSEISETLKDYGYITRKTNGRTFVQRKFTDSDEQREIISMLKSRRESRFENIPEVDGYYHAEFFLSYHKDDNPSSVSEIL